MTEADASNDRQTWIDALRLFAGVSMVGLHATADGNGAPFPDFTASDRIAPMLLRAVLYTARTELFLMISIFLLIMALQKTSRSYGETLQIQSRRLLIPFLFWTMFYALYGLNKASAFGYFDAEVSRLTTPSSWIGFLTLGGVKYHMHFIPTLFGLVLLYPLFKVAHRFPVFGLAILACLLIKRELDGFVYSTFWGADVLPYLVRMIKVATYAGYGLAGAAILGLWQRSTPRDRMQWLGPIAFLGGLLFVVKLIAIHHTITTGIWAFDYTPGYWADFLMPVVLMMVCMCLGHKHWPRAISKLARYSFGIYLCHPIFLDLAEIALRQLPLSPGPLVFLKILWTVPLTCLCVWGLSHLPPLAWTIGLGPLPHMPRRRAQRPKFQ